MKPRPFHVLPSLLTLALGLSLWSLVPAVWAQSNEEAMGDSGSSAPTRSGELLDLAQARQYMLELINRDRASFHAPPVVLDEVANRAGQIHSDEMAEYGYLAHWTLDGRKPDQRYTECGGKDTVAENADGMKTPNPQRLALCQKQVFTKHDIREIEGQFFNEKPPNDGHKVNIIDPAHTAVGIGLSVAGFEHGSEDGFPREACTQEFINHYGNYADIPRTIAPGEPLVVEGEMDRGLHFQSIDLRWEKFPEPMTIEELDKTYSYSIPDDAVGSYFPPPYESPAPVTLTEHDGKEHFAVEIQTTKQWREGLYYVCLWATMRDKKDAVLISTRTFRFEPKGESRSESKGESKSRNPQRLERR